jgi:hypothetical protein
VCEGVLHVYRCHPTVKWMSFDGERKCDGLEMWENLFPGVCGVLITPIYGHFTKVN